MLSVSLTSSCVKVSSMTRATFYASCSRFSTFKTSKKKNPATQKRRSHLCFAHFICICSTVHIVFLMVKMLLFLVDDVNFLLLLMCATAVFEPSHGVFMLMPPFASFISYCVWLRLFSLNFMLFCAWLNNFLFDLT